MTNVIKTSNVYALTYLLLNRKSDPFLIFSFVKMTELIFKLIVELTNPLSIKIFIPIFAPRWRTRRRATLKAPYGVFSVM